MRVSKLSTILLAVATAALSGCAWQEARELASATRPTAPAVVPPELPSTSAATRPISPIDVQLSMTPLDGEVIFRKEPFDRSSFPVTMHVDGKALPGSVTVSGSFSRRFLKKSLRIALDDGARWNANQRVSFNGMATDPSYLRNWAAWDLAHALDMVAPRTEMIRLFINDRYVGPFMFFDWIDTHMMERQGLGADGALYHPIDDQFCGDLRDPRIEELRRCWFQFAPRGGDFSELLTLSRGLVDTPVEDFEPYLDTHFDVDSVIDWILLNTIASNTDSYNKNYFLYLSRKTGKWVVIPWDYDLSFGRNADPALPFPKTILNDNFQFFYTPELGNPHPLKEKFLQNPALYARFKARLAHVLGVAPDATAPASAFGWFEPERFRARLADWARTLASDVANDRFHTAAAEEFREHVEAIDYYNLARYTVLRHQVLGETVFNTARWLPYRSYPPLSTPASPAPEGPPPRQHNPLDLSANVTLTTPGLRTVAVDPQFSRPLAVFEANAIPTPMQVRVEAVTERAPDALPPGKVADQCIARTWYIDLKTPETSLTTRLTVDYLEENSLHHEIGAAVRDESKLSLWADRGGRWTRLATHANTQSNTLVTENLSLRPGEVLRLVSCSE